MPRILQTLPADITSYLLHSLTIGVGKTHSSLHFTVSLWWPFWFFSSLLYQMFYFFPLLLPTLKLVLLRLCSCLCFDQSSSILCLMGIPGHLVWLYMIVRGLGFYYVALLSVFVWDSHRLKNYATVTTSFSDSTGTSH